MKDLEESEVLIAECNKCYQKMIRKFLIDGWKRSNEDMKLWRRF